MYLNIKTYKIEGHYVHAVYSLISLDYYKRKAFLLGQHIRGLQLSKLDGIQTETDGYLFAKNKSLLFFNV